MKTRRYLAKAISEDTEEAEEGDQDSLISQEPIIIEALPAQAKDTANDTVVTPPVSPIKATYDAKEQIENSEIDIHKLNTKCSLSGSSIYRSSAIYSQLSNLRC